MGMRNMKHEAVAKDLARRAVKLATKQGRAKEIGVTLNMVSFYIRLNDDRVEFWSAEKECESPITATESEMYQMFLVLLDKTVSRRYPIAYIT